jgi:hypothetical protein
MQGLKDGNFEAYGIILKNVYILYFDAVDGIHNILIDRDRMNQGTSTLLPV